MIKIIILSFFSLLLLKEGSCQKKSKSNNSSTEVNSKEVKKQPLNVENTESEVFSISFISKGAGINRNAHQTFLNLLKEFEKQNQVSLNYQQKNWGKEGEKTYCFNKQPKIQELKNYLEKELKNFDRIHFSNKLECE